MHDALNRPLKVGDRVLIPAVVKEVSAGEDYCNVTVESAIGRRPDKQRERVSAINTGVLLRANLDDGNDIGNWATTEGTWLGSTTPCRSLVNEKRGYGVNDED